jgi:hypothetical protein
MMHNSECRCDDCKLLRIVYALLTAKNRGDLQPGDMEWALVILAHTTTLEKL